MREILFRGKRKDNGEWVEGWLMNEHIIPKEQEFTVECRNPQYFVDTDKLELYEIIPSTIGQYTGLTDKNGLTKIFEHDIVKTKYGRLCEVKWFSTPCSQCWDLIPIENKHKIPDEYDLWIPKNLEVIGNIHDNPELLNK